MMNQSKAVRAEMPIDPFKAHSDKCNKLWNTATEQPNCICGAEAIDKLISDLRAIRHAQVSK